MHKVEKAVNKVLRPKNVCMFRGCLAGVMRQ